MSPIPEGIEGILESGGIERALRRIRDHCAEIEDAQDEGNLVTVLDHAVSLQAEAAALVSDLAKAAAGLATDYDRG